MFLFIIPNHFAYITKNVNIILVIIIFLIGYYINKMFRIVSSELMFYIKSLESIDALPKEEMALQSMNDIWDENFSTNNSH